MKFSDLDLSKTYSYADYLKWSFEERLEIIKGKIFKISSAPSTSHQRILRRISQSIGVFLDKHACEVFIAPFDVRLPRKSQEDKEIITVVQPDICVICYQRKVDAKGFLGAPDIVVEILSPGDSKKELQNKYEVYEETGVKEYWIVSPQYETFLNIP